jgi:RNA polymerase sigma-70 factor (ECF subfamily)
MCRDATLADDLVQECLLRAVRGINTWKPGTNLRAWLLSILRNVFFTELRRARRRGETIEYDDTRHATSHAGTQNLAINLAAVQRAFDRLSDGHREILLLVALEEFSYNEAASVLDVPLGTVRSRLSRARTIMRELMSDIRAMDGRNRLSFRCPRAAPASSWTTRRGLNAAQKDLARSAGLIVDDDVEECRVDLQ